MYRYVILIYIYIHIIIHMLNIYVIYICIQYTHIEDMSYLVKTRGNKMGFPTIARSMHLGQPGQLQALGHVEFAATPCCFPRLP